MFQCIINLKKELSSMSKNKIKIALLLTALVVVTLGYFLFTQVIKPETIIKDDMAATQDLFTSIDNQMVTNANNAYISLEPTGYVINLVDVINKLAHTDDLQELNPATKDYYLMYSNNPDSQISVRYAINFDQSKVDNIYLIRKIDHEEYFGFNEHATLSHIIFNLNKAHNIKPSASLRLELLPVKMKNGEVYHYFAKDTDINSPVSYDSCKESLDCVYISRYKSTVPLLL